MDRSKAIGLGASHTQFIPHLKVVGFLAHIAKFVSMLITRLKEKNGLSKLLERLDSDGWSGPEEDTQPWHYRRKTMGSYAFQGVASTDDIYQFDTLLIEFSERGKAEDFLKEYLENLGFGVERYKF